MTQSPHRSKRVLVALGVVSLWVLLGAVFKLLWGTPALLPKPVIASSARLGLELGLSYKLAIGFELAVVAAALLRPRLGWWALAALLIVFDLVLSAQIAAGEDNCGCFGANFSPSPSVMLTIDTALLLVLLATRPWSFAARGAPRFVAAGACAFGLSLPWLFDRELAPTSDAVSKPGRNAYVVLEPEQWIGADIWDTPLGRAPLSASIDVNSLALDGLWVFWRATCDHCAEHLSTLKATERGERLLVLVQLEEKHDSPANRIVHELPEGAFVQHARLPASVDYVLQTPSELLLERGRIVAAKEAVTSGAGL